MQLITKSITHIDSQNNFKQFTTRIFTLSVNNMYNDTAMFQTVQNIALEALHNGANPNAIIENNTNKQPIIFNIVTNNWAKTETGQQVIKTMVAKGLQVFLKNNNNQTVFDFAKNSNIPNDQETIQYINSQNIPCNSDIHYKKEKHKSPDKIPSATWQKYTVHQGTLMNNQCQVKDKLPCLSNIQSEFQIIGLDPDAGWLLGRTLKNQCQVKDELPCTVYNQNMNKGKTKNNICVPSSTDQPAHTQNIVQNTSCESHVQYNGKPLLGKLEGNLCIINAGQACTKSFDGQSFQGTTKDYSCVATPGQPCVANFTLNDTLPIQGKTSSDNRCIFNVEISDGLACERLGSSDHKYNLDQTQTYIGETMKNECRITFVDGKPLIKAK